MLCHAAATESIKVEKMQSPTKLKQWSAFVGT